MATLLSTLGITDTAAPDPSSYSNIKAENANLSEAKSNLSSTISNISIASNAAQLAGLPASYTESLTALSNEANSTANSNMTSAQIAAKNIEIAGKLDTLKSQEALALKQQSISDFTDAVKTISERVTVIRNDKTTSPELLKQYNSLLDSVNGALKNAQLPPKPEGEAEPDPDAPTFLRADQYLDELDELNTKKDVEEKKEFNWSRLFNKMFAWFMYLLMITSVVVGFILGGIIMSNSFAEDEFWLIKVFYFIYGAAFFPLSVSMGAINPPYWVSTLIPLTPVAGAPVAQAAPPAARAPAAPAPAPAAPAAAAPAPAAAAQSILSKLTSKFPQFGGSMDVTDPSTGGSMDVTNPSTGGIFSYILVNPKNPSKAQTVSRNILRGISVTELITLIGVSVYYRLDKILLNNINKIFGKMKK